MSKYANYNEELGINSVNDVGIYATGENLKKYIPSMEDEDLEKFIVIKSKLLYVGTDEKETEIADRLGIGGGSETSDAGATVKEVQAIVDGVVEVSEENKGKIPKNDSDRLDELECTDDENGLIGTRLFDRNGLNLTKRTWNILIEYNNQNKETARYGSGYYWLKKGETYKIKGKEIEFKNDYVINYGNEEFTVLSGRAVNWNEKATLGVSENIALNLDPMSFAVFDESTRMFSTDFFSTREGRLYGKAADIGFNEKNDAYITYVWQVYDVEKSREYKESNKELYESKKGNFDEEMDKYFNEENQKVDKILYFINSELKGYGYFVHDDLVKGTTYWGGTDADFYVGVCNFFNDGNIYYLKGENYATRLYTSSLTTEEVKLNYDMTLKYRDSFKDEKF